VVDCRWMAAPRPVSGLAMVLAMDDGPFPGAPPLSLVRRRLTP
jgi:hypothetical protein